MLLKSLKLKDFRQFKGEQEITFSTDPVRNVTVIMGENGSGKTTLAQAFTWCLYGDTDFDDKSMLCKATAQSMLPGNEEKVRVELALQHNNIEYLCIREQLYSKDNSGSIRRHNQTTFKIAYKNADGQREYVPDGETELRMKEILPKELSKYFFFDGERIGNMSKEIRKGKSAEFAQAVRSLLGLSAFQSALDHLGGRNSVIKMYNESYDTESDSKIAQYTKEIEEYEEKLRAIEERLAAIDGEEAIATDKKAELEEEIRLNKDSEILAKERDELVRKIKELVAKKASSEDSLLKVFNNNAHSYFAKKMMSDALSQLAAADKIDTGIPYIHAKTIEFLIKRKKCICGADIEFGNEAYKELNDLLEFIPPQSIGTSIGQFVRECELRCKSSDTLFEDISAKFGFIREFDNTYTGYQNQINIIREKLEKMKNVGELQARLSTYERALRNLSVERRDLDRNQALLERDKERRETERKELSLKDENNRKIEVYKAYAQYMYATLLSLYQEKETETRQQLEQTVNEIFKSIYIYDNMEDYFGDIEDRTEPGIELLQSIATELECTLVEARRLFDYLAPYESIEELSENEENELLFSDDGVGYENMVATVYKGNIIKNLIMDCQSYTKYRPNETTGGIFVSWRRKEELPTGA